MKTTIGLLFLGILLFTAQSFANRAISFDLGDQYPPVELLYPVTDDIDLTGKSALQFKWKQTDFARSSFVILKK
ncbi:MAG: hypothetical protein ACOY3D_05095 [Candidatus Omnitrophota bacterium]